MNSFEETLRTLIFNRDNAHLDEKELATLLNTALDSAIESKMKQKDLKFSDEQFESKPTTIELGQFGLKNPNDLKVFLLTPAGDSVKHEIATEIAVEQSKEEERQFQIQQQIMFEEKKKTLLFHWLMDEEEQSKKAQTEFIELQQKELKFQTSSLSKDKKSFENIFNGYTAAISECHMQVKTLKQDEKILREQLDELLSEVKKIETQYDEYEQTAKEFDKEVAEYERNFEKVNKKIDSLQKESDALTVKIQEAADNDERDTVSIEKQEKINLKIANLINFKTGQYVDADGTPVDSYHKARFVLPKNSDQRIEKRGGEYYLFNKDESFETHGKLAHDRFKYKEQELLIVKETVALMKKNKLDTKIPQVAETSKKLVANQAEQALVKNKINTLQAARANAAMQQPDREMEPPTPTARAANIIPQSHTAQSKTPILSASLFVKTVHKEQTNIKQQGKQFTFGDFFKIFNRSNTKTQKEIEELLPQPIKKLLKILRNSAEDIKNSIAQAPIPDVIMDNFLKNKNLMGSPEKGDLELQTDLKEQQQPTKGSP